jgi:uncharacterized protein
MRVLLDTNVLVAAFIARGTCSELFEHCAITHTLVSSAPLLDEFAAVLRRKFGANAAETRFPRCRCCKDGQSSSCHRSCRAACVGTSDDDVVLATALAGRCHVVVSGDLDLLVLNEFEGIPILPPAAFWKLEAASGG